MNETCREHYLCLPNIGRCPFCEIDRLRAELETTKRHMAEDTRDIGALEDEVATLRAELTKAQDVLTKINDIRNSIIGTQTVNFSAHVYPLVKYLDEAGLVGKGYEEARTESLTLIEQRDKAEARIKELELALSGKTFSYDPDSYVKGMEEALEIALNGDTANLYPEECQDLALEISDRIKEVKNETNKA